MTYTVLLLAAEKASLQDCVAVARFPLQKKNMPHGELMCIQFL